jgi:hypothetical protein
MFFPDTPAKPASIALMLPEAHPLIEAVTKPLANNAEQRLAANALLGESLNETHPAVAETLARLERADRKKFPRLWRVCLHVCAAVAFLLLAIPAVKMRQAWQGMGFSGGIGGEEIALLPENLTPSQRLLVGDPALPTRRQRELLHLSAPERADFFTEYAGAYASDFKKLPDGYLETTARIDPDNAFHLYNAAARNGGDFVEKVKPVSPRPTRYSGGKRIRELPDEAVWKIKDEAKFNGALELIAKAATLPRYDTYETSLAAARLPLFPQDRIIPRIRAIAHTAGQTTQVISLRKATDLISAKAYFLSLAGDTEGFLKLHADSEAFLAHIARSPESHLVGELVYAVCASGTANAFHFGAERLGLPELAGEMQRRRQAFIDDANMREQREDAISDHIETKASSLAALTAPMVGRQVANPPPFDPESLTPGRLSEYDVYSSLLLALSVVTLGLAALAIFLLRALLPGPVKIVSKRFDLLLRPVDWAWVAGAVVAPIAFTLTITRYTSLGGRDFSVHHNEMLFPAVHHLLVLLMLLTVPPLVIRWRLGKRLGAFGMMGVFRPLPLIPPAVGFPALLIAHPVIRRFSDWHDKLIMLPFALILAAWCISILIGFLSIHFGKREPRIARAAALSALPTALSFAIILLAALVPVYRESAERWIAKDELTRAVVNGLSAYEAEIARRKRSETNAILGIE